MRTETEWFPMACWIFIQCHRLVKPGCYGSKRFRPSGSSSQYYLYLVSKVIQADFSNSQPMTSPEREPKSVNRVTFTQCITLNLYCSLDQDVQMPGKLQLCGLLILLSLDLDGG